MAGTGIKEFARLVKALTKKNLRLLVLRHWLSTLLQAIVAPVVIYALLLNIRNYSPTTNRFGEGSPTPIHPIQNVIPDSQYLVLIRPPNVGSDIDEVIERVTAPLAAKQYALIEQEADAAARCRANFRGVSSCYAIVGFIDSPLTEGRNKRWNYTLQFDEARTYSRDPNVHKTDSDVQTYHLPTMLAIDNAITGSSDVPREYLVSESTQEDMDRTVRVGFNTALVTTYVIIFFLGALPPIYHVVSFVSGERADGVSQLVDAMGGSPAARVLSSILALSAVQLLGWILSGVLYYTLLFYESNAAILIFWQIFAGLSFVCSTVFAAAWFQRRRISSIFVVICVCCLAGGAAILLNRMATTTNVAVLSTFFPPMNYIFALAQMGRFAMFSQPIQFAAPRSPVFPESIRMYFIKEKFYLPVVAFWGMLFFQIAAYTLLAIVVEKGMHGISFRGRILANSATAGSSTPDAAIRTVGLTKVYPTTWYKKWLGINDGTGLRALDGVDLVAQKSQILCLLGVNGAGKSTTLDLLSGFHTPTAGEMFINARPSQLGICPQRNVLFGRLTVLEHVKFWSEMKGGREDLDAIHAMIAACDLTAKTNSQARHLSGGQKRKLQLACMFIGGATVCLMDEVTTGLDPISRRTIWNIILAERTKRSMVFTTHFLDEGEVLGDHIIILSKGQIKCQGSGAELKNRFGGGYRVYVPKEVEVPGINAPKTWHQDRAVYRTPDSTSAAQLVARVEAAGAKEVRIAGPTVEDVFLRVAQDDVSAGSDSDSGHAKLATTATPAPAQEKLSAGKSTTFFQQVRVLMMKRLRILPRYWVGAFLALALPILCMPFINGFMDAKFSRPDCGGRGAVGVFSSNVSFRSYGDSSSFYWPDEYLDKWSIGPASANRTLFNVMNTFAVGRKGGYNMTRYNKNWVVSNDWAGFQRQVRASRDAGIWMGDREAPATIAHKAEYNQETLEFLRAYTAMRSGVDIDTIVRNSFGSGRGAAYLADSQWTYILYAAIIMAVYPSFFALYPAFERTSKVRALQLSNGVRPLPMWTAYFLFDLCFVLAVSIAYTVTISMQFPYWEGPEYMFPVCLFYGITGILIGYIISTRAASQLSSFLWTLGFSCLTYFALALAYTLPSVLSDQLNVQKNTDIVSYVLDLVFPIGNVFRGMAIGLNLYQLACRDDGSMATSGSWYGYGFPITYLAIQIILLALLLVWIDSDMSFSMLRLRRHRPVPAPGPSSEERAGTTGATIGVEKEAARVETMQGDDLLRMVHVSKSFGDNLAVDNLSLGLEQNEILALLGPNGAGKTTSVELLRGELKPDSGKIYLRDVDVTGQARQLTQSIGVCPQFDALDLLTTRQHLEFYARIKGISGPAVRANADIAMARVGLTPHATKQASKLSGGNRRKLSLAIALMGDPAVLILDEPSSAMDAAAKRKMWRVLAEEIAPGRSVLLTTHSMEEADALATRAAILSKRLLAIGTTQSLRQRFSNQYHVELVLKSAPHSTADEMRRVEEWVGDKFSEARMEGVNLGGLVRFMVPVSSSSSSQPQVGGQGQRGEGGEQGGQRGEMGVGKVIALLEEHKETLGVQDYSIGAPTLERVFLSVVRDNFVEEEERKRPAWRRFLGLA